MYLFEVGEKYCAACSEKIASLFLVMIKITRINLELHSDGCTCTVDTEQIFQIGWFIYLFIFCKTSTRHVKHLFSGAEYQSAMGCTLLWAACSSGW